MTATPQHASRIIRSVSELDSSWLREALGCGPIESLSAEQIGTGQMSESHRISLSYADEGQAGPATVVLKIASADPSSRATGVGLGIYAREVLFYRELAPRIGGPLATCHLAGYDEARGWFTLLLEDAAPAESGDQIAGCGVERARLAMLELARLHAPVLEDRELEASDWLNRASPVGQALVEQLLPGFLERYGERIFPEHRALCERFVGRVDGWLGERRAPLGLVHGDFRLDNLLFGAPGSPRPLTVVDWQTVSWGGAMTDAAYFIGGSLELQARRTLERELFEEYHDALSAQGVRGCSAQDCWTQYRRLAFGGVLMVIVASMIVQRTERGDEMFMAMLARHGQQAIDLESEELLEGSDAARSRAAHTDAAGSDTASTDAARSGAAGAHAADTDAASHAATPQPAPGDEGAHPPGPEELWNESWYFDAVADDAGFGAYVRLGLYPNLGVCWYSAFVCGPGRPTVAVIDFAAPPPAGASVEVATEALRADQSCREPLERFGVALAASAEAHEHPAGPLRGERGERIPLELELEWDTAGIPYAYRLTTRYEIPCRVTGTIQIGDETLQLSGAPGQRDHSWGVRDWWSMDWMWSALHLDDGTHLHAVQLRLPGAATLGAGYMQLPRGELVELERVHASERLDSDGLVAGAELALEPGAINLAVEPLAFGPLRLVSPDGRVSHFPRAMCRVRCDDGRGGLGWVEWNLNQR